MIDWEPVPIGTVALILTQIVVQTAVLAGLYYGIKADIAKLSSDLSLAIIGVRSDMSANDAAVKEQILVTVGKIDDEVRTLTHRVGTLEAGQDEWTKALRQRTHDLANALTGLALKVDRLERPQRDLLS